MRGNAVSKSSPSKGFKVGTGSGEYLQALGGGGFHCQPLSGERLGGGLSEQELTNIQAMLTMHHALLQQ